MIPDFSPRMLRLFIEGRIIRTMIVDGLARPKARQRAMREIGKGIGLPARCIELAHAGKIADAAQRARIWAFFGVFPGDFAVQLTDDGEQVTG